MMRIAAALLCAFTLVAGAAPIQVLDDRVTDRLSEKFMRGERPSLEHFRLGEVWSCLHHFSQPRSGHDENSIEIAEFRKVGPAIEAREGKLYPGSHLKGHRFTLQTQAPSLKDPLSATYITHDPKSDSLIIRFGEAAHFGTSYMICRPREGDS